MSHPIEAVGQIALPVTDPDRSQAFYGELLGLSLLYRFGPLVFFSAGNLRLMLSAGEGARSRPPRTASTFGSRTSSEPSRN